MVEQQRPIEDVAHTYAETAGKAYADTATYLRAASEGEWSGPTGCADWTLRDLAGHVVGEAVWFPNLVRGLTRGEDPLPNSLYESLKTLAAGQLAGRLEEAARSLAPAVAEATPDQLRQAVDLGFTKMPLWQATYIPVVESTFHNWDARVGRDPGATIPTPWALQLASGMAAFAPMIAREDGVREALGRYLLRVGDGVGLVTITAENGRVGVEPGATGVPDATLHLTADQYVRLIAGRLDLTQALERGTVTVEGDRERAIRLNRIFQGIGG